MHYLLGPDGRTPEPFDVGEDWERFADWARLSGGGVTKLRHDDLPCGGYVSTIFLGLDHWEPPRLFETMAFDAEGKAAFQHRETTYERAMKTHGNVLKHVMGKLTNG